MKLHGPALLVVPYFPAARRPPPCTQVDGLYSLGGTVLGTAPGFHHVQGVIDGIQGYGINMLFVIGGIGGSRAASAIHQGCLDRGITCAVASIPKSIGAPAAQSAPASQHHSSQASRAPTAGCCLLHGMVLSVASPSSQTTHGSPQDAAICFLCRLLRFLLPTAENDLVLLDRCFGFETAVFEAQRSIMAADVEARSAYHGVGLVKLIGRQARLKQQHNTAKQAARQQPTRGCYGSGLRSQCCGPCNCFALLIILAATIWRCWDAAWRRADLWRRRRRWHAAVRSTCASFPRCGI